MGSRSDLLKTIETQKEQLVKYQTKLRDVVSAYKGLVTEKAALEASVQALSAVQGPPRDDAKVKARAAESKSSREAAKAEGGKDGASEKHGDEGAQEEAGEQERPQEQQEQGEPEQVALLQEQLRTLTGALATVSQEKSKMEASFQADKKKIRQEHEEEQTRLREARGQQDGRLKELHDQSTELRGRVRSAQREREKEQDDHAVMLRELHQLLAREKAARETLENQLDDSRAAQERQESVSAARQEQAAALGELRAELAGCQQQLREAREEAAKPKPVIEQLHAEMAEVKAQQRIRLQQEQRRAVEAEAQLSALAGSGEAQVAGLEARVSELSDLIGQYERRRAHDQAALAKLRERVTQLDLENTALAKAAHSAGAASGEGSEAEEAGSEEGGDVQSLVDRIMRLKGMLKLANDRTDRPVDLGELLGGLGIGSVGGGAESHEKCQDEYERLKEEFERYKLRAQSVLKNKVKEPSPPSAELEAAQRAAAELKERVRFLRQDLDHQAAAHKDKEEALSRTLAAVQDKQRLELVQRDAEYKAKVSEVEGEIRKHRERTISLLAEKDREVEHLRRRPRHGSLERSASSEERELSFARHLSSSSEIGASGVCEESADGEAVLSELLARRGAGGGAGGEAALLHFAQEQARREVESSTLRRQKHGLETALRDLQHSAALKEQRAAEIADGLREEIRKLERNKSRESANLEYLKNVVYHYMTCREAGGRDQMMKAISVILQFSPAERDKVHHLSAKGWW